MGNKQSTTITNYMTCVTAIAVDVMIKNTTNSTAAVDAKQTMVIKIGKGCMLKNNKFQQLANLKVQINVQDVVENSQDLVSKFAAELDNKLNALQDKLAEGLSTVLNPGGSSNTKAVNITNITNTVKAGFNHETFRALATKMNANQLMKVPCEGTAEANEFLQELNLDIIQTLESQSQNYQKLQSDIEQRASQSSELQQNSPLAEAIVQGAIGWRGALAGQLGQIASGLLGGTAGNALIPSSQGGQGGGQDSFLSGFGGISSIISSSSVSCCIVMIIMFVMMKKKE